MTEAIHYIAGFAWLATGGFGHAVLHHLSPGREGYGAFLASCIVLGPFTAAVGATRLWLRSKESADD